MKEEMDVTVLISRPSRRFYIDISLQLVLISTFTGVGV